MNQPGMPPADSLVIDMHGGRVSPADNRIEPQGKNDLQPGPSRSVGRDVESRLRRRTRLNRRHISSGHRHPPIAVGSSRPHLRKGWPTRTQARPGAGECAWMATASLRGPNAMKSYPRRVRPRPSGTEPASGSLPGGALLIAPVGTLLLLRQPLHRLPRCVIRIPRHAAPRPSGDGLRWTARRSTAGALQNKPLVVASVRASSQTVNWFRSRSAPGRRTGAPRRRCCCGKATGKAARSRTGPWPTYRPGRRPRSRRRCTASRPC